MKTQLQSNGVRTMKRRPQASRRRLRMGLALMGEGGAITVRQSYGETATDPLPLVICLEPGASLAAFERAMDRAKSAVVANWPRLIGFGGHRIMRLRIPKDWN